MNKIEPKELEKLNRYNGLISQQCTKIVMLQQAAKKMVDQLETVQKESDTFMTILSEKYELQPTDRIDTKTGEIKPAEAPRGPRPQAPQKPEEKPAKEEKAEEKPKE